MAIINGTSGVDDLIGTPEGDDILGGLGDDILTGGGGADKFFFLDVIDTVQVGTEMFVYSTDGCDIIKDFSHGEDSINFTLGGSSGDDKSIDPITNAADPSVVAYSSEL